MAKAEKKNTGEELINEMVRETHQHMDIVYPDGVEVNHVDIKGYSLNGPYLVVQLKDDTQYIYHMGNTKSLKIFVTKE